MKEKQNFIKIFKEGKPDYLLEQAKSPCILLFYAYLANGNPQVDYCHFDELNRGELKIFVNNLKGFSNKIAFFGGYDSKNTLPILRLCKKRGLEIITDKDFISSPPVAQLIFDKKGLTLIDFNRDKVHYSYNKLVALF